MGRAARVARRARRRGRRSRPPANTWPVFQHEAARSHAATFPSRADEYGPGIRAKLDAAQRVDPDDVTEGYRALLAWRQLVPEVDLYVSPCVAIDWPAEDADELDVRLPLSSFLRWVNLLGWAALAIGNLQLVAPRDEAVLAAGLAWEEGVTSACAGQAPSLLARRPLAARGRLRRRRRARDRRGRDAAGHALRGRPSGRRGARPPVRGGLQGHPAVGEPRDAARRGHRALDGATPERAGAARRAREAYDEYYAGLRLGATIYGQTRSLEAYKQTVVRANAFLADADRIATELGATECTVRPFPDR